MAKAVKKKEKSWISNQEVRAVAWGLLALYGGGALIFAIQFLLVNQLDDPETINNNVLWLLFSAIIVAAGGWLTLKKSKKKAWYLAVVPSLVILLLFILGTMVYGPKDELTFLGDGWILFPVILTTSLDYFNFPFSNIIFMLLLPLLGGYAAKHVRVK